MPGLDVRKIRQTNNYVGTFGEYDVYTNLAPGDIAWRQGKTTGVSYRFEPNEDAHIVTIHQGTNFGFLKIKEVGGSYSVTGLMTVIGPFLIEPVFLKGYTTTNHNYPIATYSIGNDLVCSCDMNAEALSVHLSNHDVTIYLLPKG
ncbi:MAG: hypothetical protein ACOCXQ_00960 [Patescibacteria group bacterium]